MRDSAKDRELDRFQELFEEFLAGRVSLSSVLSAITHLLDAAPDHACAALQDMLDRALGSGRLPEQTWERLTCEIDQLVSEDDPTDWSDNAAKEARPDPCPLSEQDHKSDIQEDPAPELMPGSLLDDRYVVVSCEGTGSTGRVYKALDRKRKEAGDPNPWVAVKVLDPALRCDATAMQTLRNEIDIRRTLSHPNIVQVFDFVQQDSVAFISMEWINGESLAKLLDRKRHQPLDTDQADRIISGIGQALAHAHGQRVVHGDIKPGNMMITPDGEARLLDFGFARLMKPADGGHDSAAVAAHTPAWSSCEVLEGQAPTVQDDLFALALVSYRLLTGHRAFEGSNALQAEAAGLSPAPVASLPPQRREALERALAFRRPERTRNVDGFLQQFFSAASATPSPNSETFNPTSMGSDPIANHTGSDPTADPAARRLGHPGRVAVAAGLAAIAIAAYLNTRIGTPPETSSATPDDIPLAAPSAPATISPVPETEASALQAGDAPSGESAAQQPVSTTRTPPEPGTAETSTETSAPPPVPGNEEPAIAATRTNPSPPVPGNEEPAAAATRTNPSPPVPGNEEPATGTIGESTPPPVPGNKKTVGSTEAVALRHAPVNEKPVAAAAGTRPTDAGPVLASTQTLAMANTAANEPAEPPFENMGPPAPINRAPEPLPSEIGPAAPAGPRLVSLSKLNFDRYIEPRFPRRVPAKLDEGWVLIQFDVTTEGRTTNIRILESEPAETFDEAAVKAISRWRFKPPRINGESIEARSRVRLVFRRE